MMSYVVSRDMTSRDCVILSYGACPDNAPDLFFSYWQCIHHAIDPVHNLFTGTAHKVLATWKSDKIFTNEHLEDIQTVIDAFCMPGSVGSCLCLDITLVQALTMVAPGSTLTH